MSNLDTYDGVIAIRKRFVVARRNLNVPYQQILNEWNEQEGMPSEWRLTSYRTLGADYRDAMRELREATMLDASLMRESQREYLEMLLRKLQDKVDDGDVRAIAAATKISGRISALYGLDMPIKIAATDTEGNDITRSLTDEERMARIEVIMQRAEERRRLEAGEPEENSPEDVFDQEEELL